MKRKKFKSQNLTSLNVKYHKKGCSITTVTLTRAWELQIYFNIIQNEETNTT